MNDEQWMTNGRREGQVVTAAPTSAAVGAAMANGRWVGGGHEHRPEQMKLNKQASMSNRTSANDKWQMASGRSSGTSTNSSRCRGSSRAKVMAATNSKWPTTAAVGAAPVATAMAAAAAASLFLFHFFT